MVADASPIIFMPRRHARGPTNVRIWFAMESDLVHIAELICGPPGVLIFASNSGAEEQQGQAAKQVCFAAGPAELPSDLANTRAYRPLRSHPVTSGLDFLRRRAPSSRRHSSE